MLLRAFAICFSMYSRIPMPQVKWEENSKKYVICFFPFIGIVLGFLAGLLQWVGTRLEMQPLPYALLLIALPIVVTGGIHFDGYLDTSDARHSYGSKEKKLEILKDPHVGAFSFIQGILYFLLILPPLYELVLRIEGTEVLWMGIFLFTQSRAFSGLAVVFFPGAKKEGTLYGFSGNGTARLVQGIMLGWCATVGVLFGMIHSGMYLLPYIGNICLFFYYFKMSKKEFGGITGDLAGWYLCMAEGFGLWILYLETVLMP